MSEVLQLRRGSAAQVAAFTGAQYEVVVNATSWRLVLQDGTTPGGYPHALVSDLATYALLASPALSGTPTAPTASAGTNSNQIATTAFVLANAPASAVSSVAGRTGSVTLGVADVSGAAPLASPVLSGTPTAPTAAAGDASTRLATTAFVAAALAPGASTTVAQGAAGSTIGFALLEELITLSGSASSSTIAIPNRAIVFAVSCRTITAITGAPSFGVGVAGNPTQFGAALGIAAGSSNAGVIGPTAFYSPTNIILTPTSGSFTGGAVRIALHFMLCGAPTS